MSGSFDPKDFKFGQLNHIKVPQFAPRYNNVNGDFFSTVNRMASDFYAPNSFANTGPYKGYVLRVEPSLLVEGTTPNPEAATDWSEMVDDAGAIRIMVRVRVPEVHASLPTPQTVGAAATPADNRIIDLYDVFPGQYLDMEPPAENEIVWVDWLQKAGHDWSEPIYINKLNAKHPGPGTGGPGSRSGHGAPCAGQFTRKSAPGDKMPGTGALLEPFQGLPRLNKIDLKLGTRGKLPSDVGIDDDKMKWVVDKTTPYNEVAWEEWKKAAKAKSNYLLKVWFGHMPGNGSKDIRHEPNSRSTLMVAPWYFDAAQPWELIYWFHGLEGFSATSFETRMIPQLNEMIKQQRNFVLIKPELPWSIRGTGKTNKLLEDPLKNVERHKAAWIPHKPSEPSTPVGPTYGGDFEWFHVHSLKRISDHFSSLILGFGKYQSLRDMTWADPKLLPLMTSIYGHTTGGSAIAQAALQGGLGMVKPDRIFFSDADEGWDYKHGSNKQLHDSAAGTTFSKYVKDSPKKIWFTMLTIKSTKKKGGPRNICKRVYAAAKKTAKDKHYIYHMLQDKKTQEWCGNNALLLVHPDHKKALEAEKKKESKTPDPPPTDEEAEENKSEAAATKAADDAKKGKTPKKPAKSPKHEKKGSIPPPQNPPKSASKIPKVSSTKNADLVDWKQEPATKWTQNRLRISNYGGTIKDKKDKRLVPIPGNPAKWKKAHKLVVDRYLAMRAAAFADGITEMKVVSAWRPHKYKSLADYKTKMIIKFKKGTMTDEEAVRKGRKFIAHHSNHELGLALDIVGHGVKCVASEGKALEKMNNTLLGQWLINNAHKFGFAPYKNETWHWECRLPVKAWITGQEFTDNYAVRVTDTGKKRNWKHLGVAQGGGTGGGGGGGTGGACVTTGGAFKPGANGEPLVVTDAPPVKGLGKKLVLTPPGGQCAPGGSDHEKYLRKLTGFCVHETAGWPSSLGQRVYKQKKGSTCGIHFWGTSDGGIVQTVHPAQKHGHCQGGSYHSCGIELTTFGPMPYKYLKAMMPTNVESGYHFVAIKKGDGDILVEPGCQPMNASKSLMVNRPKQLASLYKLFYNLSKNPPSNEKTKWKYGGKSGTTEIKIPIAFPCVNEKSGKFFFDRWAQGEPQGRGTSQQSIDTWWLKTQPPGIFCHRNVGHHVDGFQGVFYCLARARGKMSHANAFYAMIGAMVSGKYVNVNGGRVVASLLPIGADGKKLIAKGKKRYPFPINAKCYADMGNTRTRYWSHRKKKKPHSTIIKWNEYVKKNPKHIGDLNNPVGEKK